MIILKCAKNSQFKNGHNLLKNKNINKILQDTLDNIIAFKEVNSI